MSKGKDIKHDHREAIIAAHRERIIKPKMSTPKNLEFNVMR